MAKANFIRRRAKQEQMTEDEFIQKSLESHDHKTSDIANDLGISPEAVWMWLTSHGYKLVRRWERVPDAESERTA